MRTTYGLDQDVPVSEYAERALYEFQKGYAEYRVHGCREKNAGDPDATPPESVPVDVARLERAILRLRPVVLTLTQ